MKKAVFLILACVILLTGCLYQAEYRPQHNDSEVWICEEPYTEFYWGDKRWLTGKMHFEETAYNIVHIEDFGSGVWIYEYVDNFRSLNDDDRWEYLLFYASANYAGDTFTITIEDDYKDLFDGTYPTLEFKKHYIIDYFKDEK